MMKKIAGMLTALCLLAAGAALAEGIVVTDMFGREIALERPAQRVVAVSASDCEILCSLGGLELLVGRGAYCDYPPEIAGAAVVESGAEMNLEQILALAPDLVIMSDMAQSLEQVQALERIGVPVAVSNADDIAGTYEAIRIIGALIGRDAEAETIIADMQTKFDAIVAQPKATGKTIYFEISPLQYGLWTAGSGTFMDELAQLCGAKNLFGDVSGWAQVSQEQVIARNPDFIVTTASTYADEAEVRAEILARAGWQGIDAVNDGRVFCVDDSVYTRAGPRLADAALALYHMVNPE